MDYHGYRSAVLDGAKGIGQRLDLGAARSKLSEDQVRRFKARNMMTDDVWQYRSLAGGSLVAEIAYGWFLDKPLFGLTIYCVGELASDAAEWDHSLSAVYHDVASLLGRLAQLEAGGRERIAALASADEDERLARRIAAGHQ